MNEREIRGYSILAKGDNPQVLDTENYLVKSQSGNGKYRVSRCGDNWSCECPDYTYRKVVCKHINSVRFWLGVKNKQKSNFSIPELEKRFCPFCHSDKLIKRGIRRNKGEPKQRFSCKKCKKRFVVDVCSKFKGTDKTITATMDMFYKGMSVRQIQDHLKQFHNFRVHYSTIYRWIKRFTKIITDYTDEIKVNNCGVVVADETMLRAGGDWSYMWNVMDKDSRFLISSFVSKGRDGIYPRAVFEEAKWRMQNLPRVIITDGYHGYQYAKRKAFTNHKKPLEVEHVRDIHFTYKKHNNNQIERFMGSVKDRTKSMRGMQNHKTGNELMQGWVTYHNFLKPHSSLNGLTPAEAIGINFGVSSGNRWLQILKKAENNQSKIYNRVT